MSTRGDRKTGTKKNLNTKALHGRKGKASKRGLLNTVEKMATSISRKISAALDSLSVGGLTHRPAFEGLEPRQMLSTASLTTNQFSVLDGGGATATDAWGVAAGTTAGVTV